MPAAPSLAPALSEAGPPGEDIGAVPALSAVSHRSLADDVTARLREAIVTGTLRPGEHLREVEISAALEVSRSPVRDAFARLGHEGLVTLRSNRGAVVVGLTAEDVDEVYTLRRSLESLAVRLAVDRASEADILGLRELASRIPPPGTSIRPREYAELDVRFHDLLYLAARHERLYACWEMLRSNIFRFLLARNLARDDFDTVPSGEHGQLVEAIATSDLERAEALISTHLEGGYERLRSAYGDDSRTVTSVLGTAPKRRGL